MSVKRWIALFPFHVHTPVVDRRKQITVWRPELLWGGIAEGSGLDWMGSARQVHGWMKDPKSDPTFLSGVFRNPEPRWSMVEIFQGTVSSILRMRQAVESGITPRTPGERTDLYPREMEIYRRLLLAWVFLEARREGIHAGWTESGLELEDRPDWVPSIPLLPRVFFSRHSALQVSPDPFLPQISVGPDLAPPPMGRFRVREEENGISVEIGSGLWADLRIGQPREPGGMISIRTEQGGRWDVWTSPSGAPVDVDVWNGEVDIVGLMFMAIGGSFGTLAILQAVPPLFPADMAAAIMARSEGIDMNRLSVVFENSFRSSDAAFPHRMELHVDGRRLRMQIYGNPRGDGGSEETPASDENSPHLIELQRRVLLAELGNMLRLSGGEARPTTHGLRVNMLPARGVLCRPHQFIRTSVEGKNAYNPWNRSGVFDVDLRRTPVKEWAMNVGRPDGARWIAIRLPGRKAVVIPPEEGVHRIAADMRQI